MLEAIKYSNGNLLILDQLQLPHTTYYEKISTIREAWCAIKEMKVRGAPAISIVAALSLAVHLQQAKYPSTNALYEYVSTQMKYLMTSRPTAVNLQKVCEFLIKQSKQFAEDDVTVEDAIDKMIAIIENLMEDDICINKKIGELGGKHIHSFCGNTDLYMLTHCNTGSLATAGYGTALGVIRWLFQSKSLNRVYCTETRPYNQGARLTAYELLHDNIPATLICDSMVAALMKTRKVSAVVVGADRVVKNGDTANKIGTYQIAVCAKHHSVPFYVACPTSSIDFSLENGDMIPIEERSSNEMTSINSIPIAAEGINCWNPAFDITPAELISGIITEHGVFSPNALHANMHKLVSSNFT